MFYSYIITISLLNNWLRMKNLLASTRSRYIFTLSVIALIFGVLSKELIRYPGVCLPMNKQEITYFFWIWMNNLFVSCIVIEILIAIGGIYFVNQSKKKKTKQPALSKKKIKNLKF